MSNILNNGDVIYYAVYANGQPVTSRFETKHIAEIEKQKLCEQYDESVLEVVCVTADNRRLLLEG